MEGSAGIGRTGMLILMDTAISLLNVNEPVYPLDIVKNMRDQRPSMVQNVVSVHDFVKQRVDVYVLRANDILFRNSISWQ